MLNIAATVTEASTALPPSMSTFSPAAEASGLADATTPRVPITAGIAPVEFKVSVPGLNGHPVYVSQGPRLVLTGPFHAVAERVIADEPTTALDVTIQGQILHEVQKLCRETGTALIWITHDLSVVAGLADRICVMYSGRIVESGPQGKLVHALVLRRPAPAHRYRSCARSESGIPCLR